MYIRADQGRGLIESTSESVVWFFVDCDEKPESRIDVTLGLSVRDSCEKPSYVEDNVQIRTCNIV